MSTGRSSRRSSTRRSSRTRNTVSSAPVHLVMDIRKDGDAYRVTGQGADAPASWSAAAAWSRSRCRSTAPSSCATCRRRSQRRSAAEAEEREIDGRRSDDRVLPRRELDLGELMREQFVLALPMKPLCREACKGLCPQCGTNLNKATCDCAPAWKIRGWRRSRALLDKRRRAERSHAESQTPAFEDAHGQAPHARRAEAGRPQRVPAVPRGQAAAPGLPATAATTAAARSGRSKSSSQLASVCSSQSRQPGRSS